MCAPGMTLEEYFAQAQPWEEPIFEVVEQHLSALAGDDLIIDPITMGIMFKHGPMVCELRSMKKWVALGFVLDRRLSSSRLSRKVIDYQGKFFHVINVDDPADDRRRGEGVVDRGPLPPHRWRASRCGPDGSRRRRRGLLRAHSHGRSGTTAPPSRRGCRQRSATRWWPSRSRATDPGGA